MAWWTDLRRHGWGTRAERKENARHTRGQRETDAVAAQFREALDAGYQYRFECPHGFEFTREQAEALGYDCSTIHDADTPHVFPRSQ